MIRRCFAFFFPSPQLNPVNKPLLTQASGSESADQDRDLVEGIKSEVDKFLANLPQGYELKRKQSGIQLSANLREKGLSYDEKVADLRKAPTNQVLVKAQEKAEAELREAENELKEWMKQAAEAFDYSDDEESGQSYKMKP